jgi:hypothetical protein
MPSDRDKTGLIDQALDSTSTHRLLLIYEVVQSPLDMGERACLDFHSLVWQQKDKDAWTDEIVITKAAFERGSVQGRWVNEVRSIDPGKGCAVLGITEGEVFAGCLGVCFTTSLREWDLVANKQVCVISAAAYSRFNV